MLLQERVVVDRHSVVAVETLMHVHAHFELTTALVRRRSLASVSADFV